MDFSCRLSAIPFELFSSAPYLSFNIFISAFTSWLCAIITLFLSRRLLKESFRTKEGQYTFWSYWVTSGEGGTSQCFSAWKRCQMRLGNGSQDILSSYHNNRWHIALDKNLLSISYCWGYYPLQMEIHGSLGLLWTHWTKCLFLLEWLKYTEH